MHTQPQQPSGVLKPFKLESIIKGFFKPLTGVAPSASNIEAAVTPMVGCHITLQGVGVQWICSKVFFLQLDHAYRCFLLVVCSARWQAGLHMPFHMAKCTVCQIA